MNRLVRLLAFPIAALFAACGGAALPSPLASPTPSPQYELWVLDQAETAPNGGGTLSIYRGADVEKAGATPILTVNLAEAALGVGDGIGRHPHNFTFDASYSHAVIAYVTSGHVQVMRTSDHRITASIKMSASPTGNPAAHAAAITPAGDAIIVANQGAKLLQRISADFKNESYKLDAAADLDLTTVEDGKEFPSANPSQAVFTSDGKFAYVPLRGGGAVVVDYRATPMRVIAKLGKSQVGTQACCAVATADGVWTTAQGGPTSTTTSWNLYHVTGIGEAPVAKKVLTRSGSVESHGVLAVGSYLWVVDRFANGLDIFSADGDDLATLPMASGPLAGRDPAPDLMALAPDSGLVFVSLRGKAPVTSNIKGLDNAVGDSAGVALLTVKDEGRSAQVSGYIALALGAGASTIDPHSVRVRIVR